MSESKIAVLYGSSRGTTRRIVEGLAAHFHFDYEVYDLRDPLPPGALDRHELLLFFAPTYGDDEAQEDVEDFLRGLDADLRGHFFALCCPGSSDGYGYFEPGCARILRACLLERGAQEALDAACLDAMPRLDRKLLERWCQTVDRWVEERCRTRTP